MNYLTNLDLTQNQIQNAVIHPLATAPSGTEGQVYYNSISKHLYIYDGTDWIEVGATYNLPTASATVLGGIKVGSNLTITNGVLSAIDQPTVLDAVKVNGTNLAITSKAVNILVATGTTNGTIKVNNVDIPVKGLASGAYATAYVHPNHSGDVTSTGDGITVIGTNKVTLSKMAQIATGSILGRSTALTGNVEVLAASTVRTILNIEDGANNYTHPAEHAISVITGLQTALDSKVDDTQVLTNVPAGALFTDTITTINGETGAITKADIVALGIPAQDTTYANATQSVAGLESAADKTKLDGIATGANNYSLPVASTSLGGVKSGTDITVDVSGNVSINDDSHNHTIANVDNLQSTLDAKEIPANAQAKATTALNDAKTYTDTALANLVDSSPGTLDTLNELAAALGDDPNFATTVTNNLALKTDKFVATVGGATSVVITHNLNSQDVVATLRETASPYAQVITDIEFTTVNTLTVNFAVAPSVAEYTITIIG